MNDQSIRKTIENIPLFFSERKRRFSGKLDGEDKGGFCKVNFNDRSYFELLFVDDKLGRLFLDLFPQIICEPAYMGMLYACISKFVSGLKAGKIIVNPYNGEVCVRVEATVSEHPADVATINAMERLAISISDDVERTLDRIAHGVLPDVADAAAERTPEPRLPEPTDRSGPESDVLASLFKMFGNDDDEDDDDDDDSDDDRHRRR